MEQRNTKLFSKFKIIRLNKKIKINVNVDSDYFILWGNKKIFRKSSSANFNKCFEEIQGIAKKINREYKQIYLSNQVHSNKIFLVKKLSKQRNRFIKGYDGIINLTGERIIIGIKTADCFPLFLFDRTTKIKAGLHCGWRSVNKNIIEKCIKILKQYDCFSLNVFIGPGLCKNCFQVKNDFIQKVNDELKQNIIKINNRNYFDLKNTIKNKLKKLGIDEKNIYDINLCTKHNNIFYSYRRASKILRQISFIL